MNKSGEHTLNKLNVERGLRKREKSEMEREKRERKRILSKLRASNK